MKPLSPIPDETPLVGWNEIAKYLGVGLNTVKRWAKRKPYPMPYYVTLDHPWASPFELQVWLRQNTASGQMGGSTEMQMGADGRPNDGEAENNLE